MLQGIILGSSLALVGLYVLLHCFAKRKDVSAMWGAVLMVVGIAIIGAVLLVDTLG